MSNSGGMEPMSQSESEGVFAHRSASSSEDNSLSDSFGFNGTGCGRSVVLERPECRAPRIKYRRISLLPQLTPTTCIWDMDQRLIPTPSPSHADSRSIQPRGGRHRRDTPPRQSETLIGNVAERVVRCPVDWPDSHLEQQQGEGDRAGENNEGSALQSTETKSTQPDTTKSTGTVSNSSRSRKTRRRRRNGEFITISEQPALGCRELDLSLHAPVSTTLKPRTSDAPTTNTSSLAPVERDTASSLCSEDLRAVCNTSLSLTMDPSSAVSMGQPTASPAAEGGADDSLSAPQRMVGSSGSLRVTAKESEGKCSALHRLPLQIKLLKQGGRVASSTPSGNSRRVLLGSKIPKKDRMRVLVVDDDQATRTRTALALRSCGCAVQTCSDGEEAVKIVTMDGSLNLVVMDVVMEHVNGVLATQNIRAAQMKSNPDHRLAIISYTSCVDPEYLAEYQQAGMDGLVEKGAVLHRAVGVMMGKWMDQGRFTTSKVSQTGTGSETTGPQSDTQSLRERLQRISLKSQPSLSLSSGSQPFMWIDRFNQCHTL